jgi:hypothetical protein
MYYLPDMNNLADEGLADGKYKENNRSLSIKAK